jgi:hypothetical protein
VPTLDPGSRDDNLKKSVYAHVHNTIQVGLGIQAYYLGQSRQGLLPQKWVEVALMPGVQIGPIRDGGVGITSSYTESYLNINCFFVMESGISTLGIYGIDTMKADVRQRFDIPAYISIYDYTNVSKPLCGTLRVLERPKVRDMPTATGSGIEHANISVPLRYFETTID